MVNSLGSTVSAILFLLKYQN
ncbi:hypothetical protein MXB_2398 [Myxobolus squamalis]|nr:hypothetical protein MXB_2398 [Myxobolus squamalis]